MPQFFYRSRLWIAIWVYILIIYLSLPIMRGLMRWLRDQMGGEGLGWMLTGLIALGGLMAVGWAMQRGWRQSFFVGAILLAIGYMALQLEIPEERFHFLQYGSLGVMVWFTLKGVAWPQLALACVFVVTVGAVDELIQWALPNRVGDWRDVGFISVAGLLGLGVGASLTLGQAEAKE